MCTCCLWFSDDAVDADLVSFRSEPVLSADHQCVVMRHVARTPQPFLLNPGRCQVDGGYVTLLT